MAKKKSTKKPTSKPSVEKQREKNDEFSIERHLPRKYHIPVAIAVTLVLFLIFYSPLYFGGETFGSGDIVAAKSMQTYIQAERDGYTLWNPYLFCGMPTYQTASAFKWFSVFEVGVYGVVNAFGWFFEIEYARWTLRLIVLALGGFFLSRRYTKNVAINLFVGLGMAFSTGIVVFLLIGHVTKLTSLCLFPFIFLILLRFQERFRLLDVAWLAIILQIFIQGWHVQIIFYTAFAAGIFYLVYMIDSLRRKDREATTRLAKSIGGVLAATALASLMTLDNFTQTLDYMPYSTRGGESVIEKEATNVDPERQESEYYEYHTNWSFSVGEIATFVIPSYYGFGNVTYDGPLAQGREVTVPTYFGQMAFVDVPMYMGVVVFALAIFGAVTQWRRHLFARFLAILSIVALLISFGRNFPILFDPMFYLFPYFDKFRVPSMILVLVQVSAPLLAGFGIMRLLELRGERSEKIEKALRYFAYGFAVMFGLALLLQGYLHDWFVGRLQASEKGARLGQIHDFIAGMFAVDTIVAMGLLAAVFWLAKMFTERKLGADLLAIAVLCLSMFDLLRIDARAADAAYEEYTDASGIFEPPPAYITALKNANIEEPYRILSVKSGGYGNVQRNQNFHAYYLVEDLYGYSGIKPRTYQDLMDVVGSPANPTLWRMLNTRFVVADANQQFPPEMDFMRPFERTEASVIYENLDALPRAYFVDSVAQAPAIEILQKIRDNAFDPKRVAYPEDESVAVEAPDSTASVEILSYKDERIEMKARASGTHLLFVGDTYLPYGWRAYIDGEETDILRVNHGFRGVVVPEGEHEIVMEFAPTSFYVSRTVMLTTAGITLAMLAVGYLSEIRRRRRKDTAEAPAD
ncbi:MAG: YfhO family protein [Ignavibacteriales bacterium]|nr:YfhO family protein [Ignavibacteriales bacterium]